MEERTVKVRTIGTLAAALSVWAGSAATAQEPSKLKVPTLPVPTAAVPTGNQVLADECVNRMAKTGSSADADVKLTANAGTITISGTCKDDSQKKAMLEDIRVIPGVKLVRDGVKVVKVMQTQAIAGPLTSPAPAALPPATPPVISAPPLAMIPPRQMGGDPIVDPIPVGPYAGAGEMGAPPLPNHAWPTYAPYNNVSRVAYPTAYPYNAFPYIGPFYPFPKVPLGWRKVTLEWDDGHWWLGRKQAPVDYWRVRFGY